MCIWLLLQKDLALAKAINSLIQSKAYRKALGERGKIKDNKEFDSIKKL